MEDAEHLDIPLAPDFNPLDTNSIKMAALRGKAIKAIRTAAAKESRCLCKRFSKCCQWNFNLG